MQTVQISDHIWSLKKWMLIPIHVWIVIEDNGVTLVDAGMPSMAKGILEFIERLEAGPLKRIILTHGHPDHVGAAEGILKTSAVPVYAHRIEIPFMEGDIPYPRRKKAAKTVAKKVVLPLPEDENDNLKPIGGLVPYFTPGHSPGHVVYCHKEDGVLLAGDLFTSKKGKLHRPMPMFTADMNQAVKSSEVLKQLKPERLEVCHGKSVFHPANQVDEYIRKTGKAFSLPVS